jgi:hypothetical protein
MQPTYTHIKEKAVNGVGEAVIVARTRTGRFGAISSR